MTLIDDIERIGQAVELGANREQAVLDLRALFEAHPAGTNIDGWSARDLLADWRDVRRRYEAIRTISHGELGQLRAIACIEADEDPAVAEQTEAERASHRARHVPVLTCGVQIPASAAKNLGADPATTCARILNHVEPAHADAVGDVFWIGPKPVLTLDVRTTDGGVER